MNRKPLAIFAIRQLRRTTGAVRNAIEQAEYVRDMGYKILFCVERVDKAKLEKLGFDYIRIPRFPIKGYTRRIFFDWCIQRYVSYVKPDLFISHGDTCSHDVLVMHNCAALAHEQISGSPSPPDDELVRFQGRVIQQSHFRYLITNSELMKRDLVERYKLDTSKVGVFYQGVDTGIFNRHGHEELRYEGRRMLGLPDEACVAGLITSGAFQKRNVRFFLEVAASVRTHLPEAYFLIAGRDSAIESYRDYAKQLGIENVVIFASTIENVQLYFHALDVFVYPAKIEEYGRVILEVLACGIPAIVSSAVGASEIMEQGKVPTILKGWDVKEWADELVTVVQQPGRAQEQTQAGMLLAEKYSQSNRGRAMKELLARLTTT